MPAGIVLWCDLEGVARRTEPAIVSEYCNKWHESVDSAGYVPGLYVGSAAGLDPAQLYALRFTHYWGAYNLDVDERPAIRGLQMRQAEVKKVDRPKGVAFEFQTDVVVTDALGGTPVMLGGQRWLAGSLGQGEDAPVP